MDKKCTKEPVRMSEDDFAKVGVGDIVSHTGTPWGKWVVVGQNPLGGWHVCRIIPNIGQIENHRMTNHREWVIISKVSKRKILVKDS